MAEQSENVNAPTVEVTLLRPHEHNSVKCKKGDKITVTLAQSARLQSKGVIAQATTGSK